jgi:putative ABC transport system permease protein
VRAQRISEFNLEVTAIMGKLDMFLLLAVSLALMVGGVGIANTMLMSTTERFVEFGVMRTNGWTRRNILVLVTTESALLGFLSGVVGARGRGRIHCEPLPERVRARPDPG